MSTAFWLTTAQTIAKRVGIVLAVAAAIAGGTYVLWHLTRFLLAATAEERAWTGITVVFFAGVGLAWWVVVRLSELLNAADVIGAHTEAAAQHATRAGLDGRAMLEQLRDESAVLRAWWHAHSDPDPETEPMPRVGTDTAQAPAIAEFGPTPPGDDRIHDLGMAEVLAHADQDLIQLRAKWDEIAAKSYDDKAQEATK